MFASTRDGFSVFGISLVGSAGACDLALLCHRNSLRPGNKDTARQLVTGDPAALFYISDNVLGIGADFRKIPYERMDAKAQMREKKRKRYNPQSRLRSLPIHWQAECR